MKKRNSIDMCPKCNITNEFIIQNMTNSFDTYIMNNNKLEYNDTYSEFPNEQPKFFCKSCNEEFDYKKYNIKID